MALEAEARNAGTSLSALLDRIAKDWLLAKKNSRVDDDEEQARLHADAAQYIGTISAGRNYAENAHTVIRNRLRKRYGR